MAPTISLPDSLPGALRSMDIPQLEDLAQDVRAFIQQENQDKPGHIKSSLGAVELAVALHHVLDTPHDLLIWDVGHQAYAHKVLTGRAGDLKTMRSRHGLSGFPNRKESDYDVFGTGHSSTSLSALAGMAAADALSGVKRRYAAVMGDGALTAGQAFEALNHIGEAGFPILLILNDNQRSIDANVGGLQDGGRYQSFFESLGWTYAHEPAGNSIPLMLKALRRWKETARGPYVLHVETEHGLGYTLPPAPVAAGDPDWQEALCDILVDLARHDEKLVVVTPAMTSGSGLKRFAQAFPGRLFDVGIAEQHAVTFAAGLAAQGYRPLCHLYSTFAQRAMDQVIHDVALQNLPVTFLIDRSGLVGEDGPTHHGTLDVQLLSAIPGMVVSAPVDADDLEGQLRAAVQHAGPWAIRIPRGGTAGHRSGSSNAGIQVGKGLCIREGTGVAGLVFGPLYREQGWNPDALYNLRFAKPLDEALLARVFAAHEDIVLLDDGHSLLGESIATLAVQAGYAGRLTVRRLPDAFIPHGKRVALYDEFLEEEVLIPGPGTAQ